MTRSSTVARLTTSAELVASLPLQLGFSPQESLVVLCLHEPRGRVGLTLRYDLPDEGSEPALAAEVAARVRHERATRVAVVVLTEQPGRLPRRGLVEQLAGLLEQVSLAEGLLVRDGRVWSYLCRDDRCCPPGGTEVRTAAAAPPLQLLAAETVLRGRPVLASREALARTLRPPVFLAAESAARAIEQALLDRGAARAELGAEATSERELARWRAVLDRWAEPPAELGDQEPAGLVVALADPGVRGRLVEHLAGPDGASGDPLVRLLTELCRRTPAPYDATVCALLGWGTYAAGGGALTTLALERALDSDPDHPLARLLMQALQAQVPPGVLRRAAAGPEPRRATGAPLTPAASGRGRRRRRSPG